MADHHCRSPQLCTRVTQLDPKKSALGDFFFLLLALRQLKDNSPVRTNGQISLFTTDFAITNPAEKASGELHKFKCFDKHFVEG